MTVYVDGLRDYGWRHGPSCHLIADSVEELIEFAESMGMRREWFQAKSTPHFDLTAEGRAAAVAMGAIELTYRELIAKKSVEGLKSSPTPARVQQTPEPVDPADVVAADTTKQGATLFANEDGGKKKLDCKEYNRVMINGSRNEVAITGVCSQIMVNGHGNKVAAVAAAEILTYGGQNEVTYSKFANGNRPTVTDSAGSNIVSKSIAGAPSQKK